MHNPPNTKNLKIGIVDDSPLIRALIRDIVRNTPHMIVVGEAEDPIQAREMIKRENPDVITLDIEMPRMNGLDFLDKIMRLRPMPVIMVSTLTQKGVDITLRALEMGATDYVAKPDMQNNSSEILEIFNAELTQKLEQIKRIDLRSIHRLAYQTEIDPPNPVIATNTKYDIIAIASSTGGIERLRYLFSHIKVNLPPIVVVQHINQRYVEKLVERLQKTTPDHINVEIAGDEKFLTPNTIYFSGNEHHLILRKITGKYQSNHLDKPPLNGCMASADYLFHSLSKTKDTQALGLILSGMGRDGADGILALKESGSTTIGEDEQSCLVYGMPHAAAMIGGLTQEASIKSILKLLNKDREIN